MPISSVNFGRWLERLGFKLLEQPTFYQSIQPVSLVQDQTNLVSAALGPSGVSGGTQTAGALDFAAFQFFGPSPAWIHLLLTAQTAQDFEIRIGANASTLPALIGAVTLPRQTFQPGGDVRAQRGTVAVVGSPTDTPSMRVGAGYGDIHRAFKPAGGWITVNAKVSATTIQCAAWIYELPPENAQ